ncbi:unnamed protein product [Allacma fusca]|uniref:Ionotropic glutamate receptor C-terminal domain-containing protein n=1 Tax=Allacma fusca TaxID=39272 RepID=A0A8J2JQS7_9HEXA|nr:unnamed protein product [Allacma fusca]
MFSMSPKLVFPIFRLLLMQIIFIVPGVHNFSKEFHSGCNFQDVCQICSLPQIERPNFQSISEFITSTTIRSGHESMLLHSVKNSTFYQNMYHLEFLKPCLNFQVFIFNPSSGNVITVIHDVLEYFREYHYDTPFISFVCIQASEINWKIVGELLSNYFFIEFHKHIYFLETSKESQELGRFSITEIYSILNETTIIQGIAQDPNNADNFIAQLPSIAIRRSNLRASELKVVAEPDDLYESSLKMERNNGTVRFVSGSALEVLHDYQFMLNFTFKAVEGKGWISQEFTPEGYELTGIGKQVLNDEALLCISGSSVVLYRGAKLHFLPSGLFTESLIFYHEPHLLERNVLALPFHYYVWVLLLISLLILWMSVMVVRIFAPGNSVGISNEFDMVDITGVGFWLFSVVCLRGITSPACPTLRIIFVTVLFTSFIVYSIYTAEFVAAISAPRTVITSYHDLEKYDFQVFTNPTVPNYTQHFLQNYEREISEVFKNSFKLYVNDTDTALKLLDPYTRYAFLINSDGFFQGIRRNASVIEDLCRISKLKNKNGTRIMDAMFLKKNSPLKEIFVHRTVILMELGLIHRHATDFKLHTSIQCLKSPKINSEPLEWEQVIVAYKILIGGGVFAVLVLYLENIKLQKKQGLAHKMYFYKEDSSQNRINMVE